MSLYEGQQFSPPVRSIGAIKGSRPEVVSCPDPMESNQHLGSCFTLWCRHSVYTRSHGKVRKLDLIYHTLLFFFFTIARDKPVLSLLLFAGNGLMLAICIVPLTEPYDDAL